jgi:hypothetical protein
MTALVRAAGFFRHVRQRIAADMRLLRCNRLRPGPAAAVILSVALFCPEPGRSDEGKWTPEQVLRFPPARLRKLGLGVQPGILWGSSNSLLRAAVIASGCSGAFISRRGLILTNHHCVLDILQKNSSPKSDLVADGYLAANQKAELADGNTTVRVFGAATDLTDRISPILSHESDDRARFRALGLETARLAGECARRPYHKCRVVTYDGGLRFVLIDEMEFPDVRLVFAPPSAVADFGGDIDNFEWPRHSGDFAVLRVYADSDNLPAAPAPTNREYSPPAFFRVGSQAIEPDQFVMVVGYPNLTSRNITPEELQERQQRLALRANLYTSWIATMERASQNPAARLALAGRLERLSNDQKSSIGQVEGIAKFHLLEKSEAGAQQLTRWAAHRRGYSGLDDIRGEVAKLIADRRPYLPSDTLLSEIQNGPKTLGWAMKIVQHARERDTASGCPGGAPCDALERQMQQEESRIDLPTEQGLLAEFLERSSHLATLQPALRGFAGPDMDRASIDQAVVAFHQQTHVTDRQERSKMLAEGIEQLRNRHDALLDLAFALQPALDDLRERDERYQGAMLRLRPRWVAALIAHGHVSSDANATIRVSFAHVRGYSPRDGVWYAPQTTLNGILEKNIGKEPFDLPEKFLAAARASGGSRWIDRQLHAVPVDFLADADTSGGNSGSAVLNAKGELVGLNFDRTRESIANDLVYNDQSTRNISADIRYLFWMLDQNQTGCGDLLNEMMGETGRNSEPRRRCGGEPGAD